MRIEELNQIVMAGESSVAIQELMRGRSKPAPDMEPFRKDLNPQLHKVMDTSIRKDKFVKTDVGEDYESDADTLVVNGDGRTKGGMKIVPVERIALALQRLIVGRAVSFAFGNPMLVTADVEAGSKEADVFKAVKAVLRDAKTSSGDRRIARTMFTATEVAELWYPVTKQTEIYGFKSESKLRMSILSPLKGDDLYPYFDEIGDMIAFSRQFSVTDSNSKTRRYFETWTAEYHIKWEMVGASWVVMEGYPVENPIGKIPVIYGCQDEVEWATVQNLIDRLEVLLSNFADTNDYHASPKIFTTGSIQGWSQKGESGAVIEGDEGASAQYLSWNQAPEAVKLEIETLLKMVYSITQTPDISFDAVKGLNVSGISLKLLFMDAHMKVMDKAEVFDEYMQRRMSVIEAYLKQMNIGDAEWGRACDTLLIDTELVPFIINDDQQTVATLMAATGQKAVMSQRTAVQNLGWVKDVDEEINRINEENGMNVVADLMAQEPTE